MIALYVWYETEGGYELAERFFAMADAVMRDLLTQPGLGREWPTRHPRLHGLRKANVTKPFGNVLIFYLVSQARIEVVRVLHAQRDIDALLDADG